MDAQRTGKIINYLRSKKGLTQKELAALINVSDKTVSKWERGDGCPDIGTLPALTQALGTDVDSLLKGELKEVKASQQPLSASERDSLLNLLSKETENNRDPNKILLKNPKSRIMLYDFTRPVLFNKYEMGKLADLFNLFCEKVRNELFQNRADLLGIKLYIIDELTNQEFLNSIPAKSFFYSYDYNNAGFAIQIDPAAGKILLKQDYKRFPECTPQDSECLKLVFVNQFAKMLQKTIFQNTDKSIPFEAFEKCFSADTNPLLPASSGEIPNDMSLLITLELICDNDEGFINLQFNQTYFKQLCRKEGFLGIEKASLEELTDIKSGSRKKNIFVEFGRFISDDVNLEPGTILMTSLKNRDELNVVIDNKVLFKGDVIVAEEHYAARLYEPLEEEKIEYDEEHYLALRLGGNYVKPEIISAIQDGFILPLDTIPGKPVSIIKDGKCIGRGEVIIIDEMYAIKIID